MKNSVKVDTGESLFTRVLGIFKHVKNWVSFPNQDFLHINPSFDMSNANPDEDIVVYCIHGTADYPNSYHSLVSGLIDQLPNKIRGLRLVAFDKRFEQKGIDAFVAELMDKVRAEGYKKIIFLGHSRGGLIIAKCAELLMQDKAKMLASENEQDHAIGNDMPIVVAVIPIAAPFEGSKAAYTTSFLSTSVKQMLPGSKFLTDLRELMKTPRVDYYPFSAGLDEFVSKKSASLEGIDNDKIKPEQHFLGHTHISIMGSSYLVTCVRDIFVKIMGGNPQPILENSIAIKTICDAITIQIEELKSKTYLSSQIPTIQILARLKVVLKKLSQNTGGYSSIDMIGAFIGTFLNDKNVTHELCLGDLTPLEVLRSKLNGPNVKTETKSSQFALDLIRDYQDTPIIMFSTINNRAVSGHD